MFAKARRARADLATMNSLLPAAEHIARDEGIDQPGAEHLLLAALDLDDDIAREALGTFGVDAAELRVAIVDQHDEALRAVGVVADDNAIAAALPASGEPRGPYRSQGSLQAAFQQAVELAKRDKAALNSGHILLAVTKAEHGTVARTLEHLGIDPTLLRDRTAASLLARAASPGPGR
jgi:ATP-dependent Clp protease ATP-binding subunit ClpA